MKRGTPDHPKTKRLMRSLGIPAYAAVGILESLFHFTAKYAPRGDVGKFSDQDIAEGLGWDGDPSDLITVLMSTGWIDLHPEHRLIVHDWQDHADDSVKKTLKNKDILFVEPFRPVGEARTERLDDNKTSPEDFRKGSTIDEPFRKIPASHSHSQSHKPEPEKDIPPSGEVGGVSAEVAAATAPSLEKTNGYVQLHPDAETLVDLHEAFLLSVGSRYVQPPEAVGWRKRALKAWSAARKSKIVSSVEEAQSVWDWISSGDGAFWADKVASAESLFELKSGKRKWATILDQVKVKRNGRSNANRGCYMLPESDNMNLPF